MVRGAQEPQIISDRLSQPGHLLRGRYQRYPGRFGRLDPAAMDADRVPLERARGDSLANASGHWAAAKGNMIWILHIRFDILLESKLSPDVSGYLSKDIQCYMGNPR